VFYFIELIIFLGLIAGFISPKIYRARAN